MVTERTLKRRFNKEAAEGTLPVLQAGRPVNGPLYSQAGVTTSSFEEWKVIRGYAEQEDEGSTTD